LPSAKKRTARTAAVELAVTKSGSRRATHWCASGWSHVTAGPATTFSASGATDVLGRTSSLTDAVFFASWKSEASTSARSVPRFSAGACRGSGKRASPEIGS
jgi:hypothetical protein